MMHGVGEALCSLFRDIYSVARDKDLLVEEVWREGTITGSCEILFNREAQYWELEFFVNFYDRLYRVRLTGGGNMLSWKGSSSRALQWNHFTRGYTKGRYKDFLWRSMVKQIPTMVWFIWGVVLVRFSLLTTWGNKGRSWSSRCFMCKEEQYITCYFIAGGHGNFELRPLR